MHQRQGGGKRQALPRSHRDDSRNFSNKPNVLGIGEIGLNKNTANEAIIFQEHVDLAMKTDELILIHTPHLEDKYKGTRMIVDMLKNDRRVKPERVLHRPRRGAHGSPGP